MVEASGAYLAPAASSEAELRDKGSRFRAFVLPVDSEEGAVAERRALATRYADATHHCWAQRIGSPPVERSHDAGEPGGTAGAPILHVLRGAGISDVLAVVVRWYGGTKLGKGGLARAYAGVTRTAVQRLATIQRIPTVELELDVRWDQMGAVERLLHAPVVELLSADYGERVHLRLRVQRHESESVRNALRDAGIVA